MFILGDILITLANIIHVVLNFYQMVILAAVILSWVRPQPSNDVIRQILQMISRLTEPLFSWVRAKLPRSFMSTGMDFTPMIVWLGVMALDTLLWRILTNIGVRLSHRI